MALIAKNWKEQGTLTKAGIVATVMSNLGLERYLEGLKLKLERTKVGDRYVVERMRAKGYNVGGEQSGHIILSRLLHHRRRPAGGAAGAGGDRPIGQAGERSVQAVRAGAANAGERALRKGQARPDGSARREGSHQGGRSALTGKGRLLVRKSGTEPLVRIMAEGDDEALVREAVADVKSAVVAAAKAA